MPIAKRHRVLKRCSDFLLRSRAKVGSFFSKCRRVLFFPATVFLPSCFPTYSLKRYTPFAKPSRAKPFFTSTMLQLKRSHGLLWVGIKFLVRLRPELASINTTGRRKASRNFNPKEMYEFYPLAPQGDKFLANSALQLRHALIVNFCFFVANGWHTLCPKECKRTLVVILQAF